MRKRWVGGLAFTGVLLAAVVGNAARVIWEFGTSPAGLPRPIPTRVHQLTPHEMRVFDETTGVVSMVWLGPGESTSLGPGPETISMPVDLPHLTGDGSLALFEEAGVRDGGGCYAQSFDLERRVFAGDPLPLERVQRFAAGPRCIPLFLAAGELKHRTALLDELHLGVLASSQHECRLSTIWQSREFTYPVALNSNAAKDVVALVARCMGGALQRDCPAIRVIVAHDEKLVIEADIQDGDTSSAVAISQSGELIAVATGTSVHVYRIRGTSIERVATRDLSPCAPDSYLRCISVADDLSVAGVAVSKGKAEIVSMPSSGTCTTAMTLPIDDVVEFDLRFFTEDQFYLTTMARRAANSRFVIFDP